MIGEREAKIGDRRHAHPDQRRLALVAAALVLCHQQSGQRARIAEDGFGNVLHDRFDPVEFGPGEPFFVVST